MKTVPRCLSMAGGLAMLVSFGVTDARANLLVNGDFSADPVGTTMAAGVTGWTWESLNGGGTPADSFTRNDAFSAGIGGANYLWLNDNPGPEPSAFQDVAINSGVSFELTGVYHQIALNPGSFGLAILFYDASTVTPSLLETNTFPTTSTSPSDPWVGFDLVRNFSTTDLRVEFVSQYGGDADTGIAQLNLDQTAAPEPTTWALMGMGFLALLGSAWRRRREPVHSKMQES